MEFGSFIELQFESGKEYYNYANDVARLNTGRAAIYHAFRVTNCTSIWIPYYQCDTVRDFLKFKGIAINYYHIDKNFNPLDIRQESNQAVLLVNYYGIMSETRMRELSNDYKNVIIDNSQAFFCKPLSNCLNVYSCRKFIGVPDGAYVIGHDANKFLNEYEQGYSSDTSVFLLQRIEYGCEGKSYKSRSINEDRINNEDIKLMSKLTRTILDGTNYDDIKLKRIKNFEYVSNELEKINLINPKLYMDNSCIPMVYPLVVENEKLYSHLQQNKHFQGHWWSYLLDEINDNLFEYWISKNIIPITIDQRYDQKDLEKLIKLIKEVI